MNLFRFLRNKALWIAATGIGLYWLSVWAIGTYPTRDGVAISSVFVALVCLYFFWPPAVEAFKAGGGLARSRFLMSTCLIWLYILFRESWAWVLRFYDRPQWMIDHPVNGFLAFWIVAAGLLQWSAATQEPPIMARGRMWYLFVGAAGGSLLTAAAVRFFIWH